MAQVKVFKTRVGWGRFIVIGWVALPDLTMESRPYHMDPDIANDKKSKSIHVAAC